MCSKRALGGYLRWPLDRLRSLNVIGMLARQVPYRRLGAACSRDGYLPLCAQNDRFGVALIASRQPESAVGVDESGNGTVLTLLERGCQPGGRC